MTKDTIGATITVSGKVKIKQETRKDGKISKLLCLPYGDGKSAKREENYIYTRVIKGSEEYELVDSCVVNNDKITVVGELKSLAGVDGKNVNYMAIDSIAIDVDEEKPKFTNQEDRVNAKSTFVELVKDAYGFGNARFNFVKYDTTKPEGERIIEYIDIYLKLKEAITISREIANGRYLSAIKAQKVKKAKGELKYFTPVREFFGGTTPEKLAKRGKKRKDGKALARVFSIEPSNSDHYALVLTAISCPGNISATGGIVPDRSKIEQKIQVPLTYDEAQDFASAVGAFVQGEINAQKVIEHLEKKGKI